LIYKLAVSDGYGKLPHTTTSLLLGIAPMCQCSDFWFSCMVIEFVPAENIGFTCLSSAGKRLYVRAAEERRGCLDDRDGGGRDAGKEVNGG
jgi:hypothetical protein